MLEVDSKNNGHLFYWYFEAETKPETAPLLIWLNGGPGCSSMDGLFLELGPFRVVNDKGAVETNPYSWHKVANMLFIDQPVGTGNLHLLLDTIYSVSPSSSLHGYIVVSHQCGTRLVLH